jgi:hypothetical protein
VSIYAAKKPKRINAVSVTVFLVLLVVGYAAYALIPIYWPVFQLKGVLRSACNEAYRKVDDEEVMKYIMTQSRRTGLKLTKDNFRFRREPYPADELSALTQGKDPNYAEYVRKRGKTCVIDYYYRDEYTLPVVGTKLTLTFQDSVTGTLEAVRY